MPPCVKTVYYPLHFTLSPAALATWEISICCLGKFLKFTCSTSIKKTENCTCCRLHILIIIILLPTLRQRVSTGLNKVAGRRRNVDERGRKEGQKRSMKSTRKDQSPQRTFARERERKRPLNVNLQQALQMQWQWLWFNYIYSFSFRLDRNKSHDNRYLESPLGHGCENEPIIHAQAQCGWLRLRPEFSMEPKHNIVPDVPYDFELAQWGKGSGFAVEKFFVYNVYDKKI